MKPRFFPTPDDFRAWLHSHHAEQEELWVGFYKKDSGRPSITWPQSVDAALCFGWIDGIRKSLGEESYVIRFTPRRPRSIWSAVNIKRATELSELGLMHEAGLRAFKQRTAERSGIYAYEQRQTAALDPSSTKEFKRHAEAWAFFQSQPPGYRRIASWYVVSAKKDETRRKRLATLIDESARGRRIGLLTRPTPAAKATHRKNA